MFELPELNGLSAIRDFSHASMACPLDHGLGRRDQTLHAGAFPIYGARTAISIVPRTPRFGVTHFYALDLKHPNARQEIETLLQHLERHVISWQDRVSYQLLGPVIHLLPDEDTATETSGDSAVSANARNLSSVDKRFAYNPHHYGFLRLHSHMSRALTNTNDPSKNTSEESLHDMAQRALTELLPQQAYLFIPPHDLMMATKEAERLAQETIKSAATKYEKEQVKPAVIYTHIKNKLSHGIRALRQRHDGRMHIFPHTQLSAPDTGVATIAIIASQQQSIVGDHGRYSGTSRGLAI